MVQLCAALQHLEQNRDAQTARLSAQLEVARADAERTAAAAAAAHAKAYAELEERMYRDLHQVGLRLYCEFNTHVHTAKLASNLARAHSAGSTWPVH